ncbi:hypothetical protein J2Z20_001727 [Paenibacillus sediminis]|uniref:Uncharacterized protein n=1 Tax=Paenibacillus sediminis TaxID=664909 RepID=A0ABS4H311_9BACL|nr:hypothetical protein [Paenibacillus sediminis]
MAQEVQGALEDPEVRVARVAQEVQGALEDPEVPDAKAQKVQALEERETGEIRLSLHR